MSKRTMIVICAAVAMGGPAQAADEFLLGEDPLTQAEAARLVEQVVTTIPEASRNSTPRAVIGDKVRPDEKRQATIIFEHHTIEDGVQFSVVVECSQKAGEEDWDCGYLRDRRELALGGQRRPLVLGSDLDVTTTLSIVDHARNAVDEISVLKNLERHYPSFPVFGLISRATPTTYQIWIGNDGGDVIVMLTLNRISPDGEALELLSGDLNFVKGGTK